MTHDNCVLIAFLAGVGQGSVIAIVGVCLLRQVKNNYRWWWNIKLFRRFAGGKWAYMDGRWWTGFNNSGYHTDGGISFHWRNVGITNREDYTTTDTSKGCAT